MHELDDNEVLEYVVIDDDEVEVDMVLDEYDVIDDETDEPLLQITDDEVDDEMLSILDILEVPDELDADEWSKYVIKQIEKFLLQDEIAVILVTDIAYIDLPQMEPFVYDKFFTLLP